MELPDTQRYMLNHSASFARFFVFGKWCFDLPWTGAASVPQSSALAEWERSIVLAALHLLAQSAGGVRRRAANPAGGLHLGFSSAVHTNYAALASYWVKLSARAGGLDGCRHQKLLRKGLLLRRSQVAHHLKPDEAMELGPSGPPKKRPRNHRLKGRVTEMRPNRLKTLPDVRLICDAHLRVSFTHLLGRPRKLPKKAGNQVRVLSQAGSIQMW